MPAGFQFPPFWATRAELWAPLALAPRASQRGGKSLRVFARIVEPSPSLSEETRAQQIAKHHIGSTFVAEEMTRAGFTIIGARDKFAQIPDAGYYSLVVGRRAE